MPNTCISYTSCVYMLFTLPNKCYCKPHCHRTLGVFRDPSLTKVLVISVKCLPLDVTFYRPPPPPDWKAIARVCRRMRHLATDRLWHCPAFKRPVKPCQLKRLVHLPIRQLNSYDLHDLEEFALKPDAYAKVFKLMPELSKIGRRRYNL